MGILKLEELEECFKEFFPLEMEEKSMHEYLNSFVTDSANQIINFKEVKK